MNTYIAMLIQEPNVPSLFNHNGNGVLVELMGSERIVDVVVSGICGIALSDSSKRESGWGKRYFSTTGLRDSGVGATICRLTRDEKSG